MKGSGGKDDIDLEYGLCIWRGRGGGIGGTSGGNGGGGGGEDDGLLMSVDGMGGGGGASQRMAGPSPSRSPPTIGAGGRLGDTVIVLDAVLALMSHPPEPSPPPLLWTILI